LGYRGDLCDAGGFSASEGGYLVRGSLGCRLTCEMSGYIPLAGLGFRCASACGPAHAAALVPCEAEECLGHPISADRLWGGEQSCGKVTGIDLDCGGGEIGGREAWLMRLLSA